MMTGRVKFISLFDLSAFAGGSFRAPLLAETCASQTLAIILWIGLAIITVALLVLMRTRWGQAQPLSKCVVLSVFAHILFIAYAYGTRLIFDAPAPQHDEVIRLAFVSQDTNTVSTPRQRQPWDESPAEFAITPEMASPSQQEIQIDAELPPSAIAPPDFAVAVREAPLSNPGLEETLPAPPTPPAEALLPSEPNEIEVARPEPQAAPEPLPELPNPEPLDRLAAESVSQALGSTNAVTDAPTTLPDSSTLQRLTDIDFSRDLADARPAAVDMVAAADNRESDATRDGNDGAAVAESLNTNRQHESSPIAGNAGEMSPARRLGDGEPLPEVYQLRMSRRRLALIEQQGGSEQTEQAVEAALKWLAAHQSPDGRWSVVQFGGGQETMVLGHDRKGAGIDADTGITGLALLAFLSAGHT
ncbi:MAG: hypothetical protein HYV60_21160, partial [Planctomycetia bacterium]|nr:hypothetical protein [Planctomycetia bacterium]